MGGSKKYNPDGGFSEQDYEAIGRTANGIKIIEPKEKSKNFNTPLFSNTPNAVYAKTDVKTGAVDQITVYGNGKDKRGKLKDIDIGHIHINPDKKTRFNDNTIHVHTYDLNGVRSKKARKPSKKSVDY